MQPINRRHFLGASAALAAGLAGGRLLGQEKKAVGANAKVQVALVGCGSMGRANLRDFIKLPEVQVVAVCDVDPAHMIDALKDLKAGDRPTDKVESVKDYRKLMERKDLDAVIVGTPDHLHCYVLLAACASDKDVYCEKPLSHNIVEGRTMVKSAEKNKRVVQVGTQQRSGKHFQDAVKYVHDGKLGTITTCRTWITNRSKPTELGRPDDESPPSGVDYDLWLGPAPKRPFNKNRWHRNFRWFWDYGNGLCNDWGVHLNDIIMWGMKVSAPISVSAVGGKLEMEDNSDTPDTLDIYFEYPGFTHVYTVRRGHSLIGFHGNVPKKEPVKDPRNEPGKTHGMEFEGTKGTLTIDRAEWFVREPGKTEPVEKHGGFTNPEGHLAHVKNFLHCIQNRGVKPASPIEEMHRATTTCHLANISYKVKRRIYWDPVAERCYRGYDPVAKKFLQEDAEANAWLLREPCNGWSLKI